jgi:hypothetical protein
MEENTQYVIEYDLTEYVTGGDVDSVHKIAQTRCKELGHGVIYNIFVMDEDGMPQEIEED